MSFRRESGREPTNAAGLVELIQLPLAREEAMALLNAANYGVAVVLGRVDAATAIMPELVQSYGNLSTAGWNRLMDRIERMVKAGFKDAEYEQIDGPRDASAADTTETTGERPTTGGDDDSEA